MKANEKQYLITSERSHRRSDERDNLFTTTTDYNVGDVIILDGLMWKVTKVLKK